jgi:hypothetical protein
MAPSKKFHAIADRTYSRLIVPDVLKIEEVNYVDGNPLKG